jgi:hypothetical protein
LFLSVGSHSLVALTTTGFARRRKRFHFLRASKVNTRKAGGAWHT